jgi:Integrin alpha cytoplasmic region
LAGLVTGFFKRQRQPITTSRQHLVDRVQESVPSVPVRAGFMKPCGPRIADRVWSVGDLIDAALATLPIEPTATAPQRRHRFKVIDGGKV